MEISTKKLTPQINEEYYKFIKNLKIEINKEYNLCLEKYIKELESSLDYNNSLYWQGKASAFKDIESSMDYYLEMIYKE